MQIKNTLSITDKKDLKTDNPHIRQNTDLLVKWYYQIQGGHFYVQQENQIEAHGF